MCSYKVSTPTASFQFHHPVSLERRRSEVRTERENILNGNSGQKGPGSKTKGNGRGNC